MPAHVNQLTAGGRYPNGASSAAADCTVACGVMALDDYTAGRLRPSTTELRARQKDQSGGIGLDDLADAYRSYGLTTWRHSNLLWADVVGKLAAGTPLILQGMSGALGPYAIGRNVPHAIYCTAITADKSRITVHDPLATGPRQIPRWNVLAFYIAGLARAGWFQGAYSGGSGGGSGEVYGPPAPSTGRTISLAAYAGIPGDRTDNLWSVIKELVILHGDPGRPAYGGKAAREWVAQGYAGDALVERANVFLHYATRVALPGLAATQVLGIPSAPNLLDSIPRADAVLFPATADGRLDIDAMRGANAAAGGADPFGIGSALAGFGATLGDTLTNAAARTALIAGIVVLALMGAWLALRGGSAPTPRS